MRGVDLLLRTRSTLPHDQCSSSGQQPLSDGYEKSSGISFPRFSRRDSSNCRRATLRSQISVLSILVVLCNVILRTNGSLLPFYDVRRLESDHIVSRQASATTELLRNFEVTAPVYTPSAATCVQTLVVYSFGNSYGAPYIGAYNPPICDFNRVVLNLTVTSRGRQFDRLGMVYFGNTEIFRTSTAEPTATGIIWTVLKDVSGLLALFKEPQKLIFDLPNIIDQTYTGYLNVTLTATFFRQSNIPVAADTIIPVSARRAADDGPSVFTVPDQIASNNIAIPKNVKKAFFTIASCGQQTEEFWYTNVLNNTVSTFPGATLYGYSPWREVQLLIDGSLAGVAWPFPVIFTGGVVPGFWRPIAGIDAFDLKEDEIDITPWLPLLTDGKKHNFTIRVAGIGSDGTLSDTVGEYWLVTGKIFLWLDGQSASTSGSVVKQSNSSPIFGVSASTTGDSSETNTTLSYSVHAQRNLEITSVIRTSSGERKVSWKQSLSYINNGYLSDGGNSQTAVQITNGTDESSDGYLRTYSYPITVFNAFTDDTATGGNLTIVGTIDRSKKLEGYGRGAFITPIDALLPNRNSHTPLEYPGYSLSTSQKGNASFTENAANNASSSTGRTAQHYTLEGLGNAGSYGGKGDHKSTLLYQRDVVAQDTVIISDSVKGIADGQGGSGLHGPGHNGPGFVVQDFPPTHDIASLIGRVPPGWRHAT